MAEKSNNVQYKERKRKEKVRIKNEEFIKEMIRKVIREFTVSSSDVLFLRELGLLESTTDTRRNVFPGENEIFYYDFWDRDKRFMGYIGFNKEDKLVSIDEILPKMRELSASGY